jgi:D-aminoacyl-tRNA deacylase
MIALVQRVKSATITIDNKLYSSINYGYLIFLGIFQKDTEKDIAKLSDKILNLRIMADENGKMNKSILEIKGEILVVSQFTLCANLKGGRRPDFFPAKKPDEAEQHYELFIQELKKSGLIIRSGQFAAYMEINLINDGPVTFIANSYLL